MSSSGQAPEAGYRQTFGADATVVGYAPGRVNVIGEHVDYNLGPVLPFAIGQRITVAAGPQSGANITACSARCAGSVTFPLDVDAPAPERTWENYLRGVVAGLRKRGIEVPAARLWFGGDLPSGGGLSSSAALCVATARALLRLADADLPNTEVVLLSQAAEHDFAGMPCGVMDQYASACGRAGRAMLLDCQALTHREVPLTLPGSRWLVIPSGVHHALTDGAYRQRVHECGQAVAACRRVQAEIEALRDVTPALLSAAAGDLSETVVRRARHVISEIARVDRMVDCLAAGDSQAAGALLWETQASLRDDYEVSCPEVDDLIELLRDTPGVHGARMVGGGFGGVLLALVAEDAVAAITARVRSGNYRPRGVTAEPFAVSAEDGAAVVAV